jgi:hypothetical protein
MKINLEMELNDVLRISVLLDHHRAECTERANDDCTGNLFKMWGSEATLLNEKLLKAVSKR